MISYILFCRRVLLSMDVDWGDESPTSSTLLQRRSRRGENRKTIDAMVRIKAFSPKKGLVFAVNGASPPPPPPRPPQAPRPPAPFLLGGGVFTENPRGGGGLPGGGGEGQGCVRGIWGGGRGHRGPIYRENEPLFRRKRLNHHNRSSSQPTQTQQTTAAGKTAAAAATANTNSVKGRDKGTRHGPQ